MKKYRLKKGPLIVIISLIILIIGIIILASINKDKSYTLEYTLNDYKISENYESETKEYYYIITYNDVKYQTVIKHKRVKKNELINEIKKVENEDYLCLKVSSSYLDFLPLCSYKNELIDYHLVNDNLKDELHIKTFNNEDYKEVENYKIYNEDKLYLWNYKGFNYLNDNSIDKIQIFSKDIYETKLISTINNYIIIPDYEQELTFNKLYILNTSNNKVDKWEIEYDISFDSIILGTNDKSLYILDKNQKKEYELVPHKKKIRIIGTENKKGIIYNEGQSKEVSIANIIKNDLRFTYKKTYNYQIIDDILYLNYYKDTNKIKISNDKVDHIVTSIEDNVYYLSNQKLYKYNLQDGVKLLVEYENWHYNYLNMIFINNQK